MVGRKEKFWDYPKGDPLWSSHTRAGRAEGSRLLLAKSAMHLLFAFLPRPDDSSE